MMVTITAKTASEYVASRSAVISSSCIARSLDEQESIDLNHVKVDTDHRQERTERSEAKLDDCCGFSWHDIVDLEEKLEADTPFEVFGSQAPSIQIGNGLTDAPVGSARNVYLVVTDLEAARSHLLDRGVEVGEIRHKTPIDAWDGGFAPGLDPAHRDYVSFAHFSDPDGNSWVLQERGYRNE